MWFITVAILKLWSRARKITLWLELIATWKTILKGSNFRKVKNHYFNRTCLIVFYHRQKHFSCHFLTELLHCFCNYTIDKTTAQNLFYLFMCVYVHICNIWDEGAWLSLPLCIFSISLIKYKLTSRFNVPGYICPWTNLAFILLPKICFFACFIFVKFKRKIFCFYNNHPNPI